MIRTKYILYCDKAQHKGLILDSTSYGSHCVKLSSKLVPMFKFSNLQCLESM